MADKTGFTMDFKDFDGKFPKIVNNTIPERAEQGMFQMGAKMIGYAINEEPRAPHKWGGLWDSQLIIVLKEGTYIFGVMFGFNKVYAARLHEAPNNWNWTLEGSGPKYLEAKLPKHKDEAMKFVADYIRAGAK